MKKIIFLLAAVVFFAGMGCHAGLNPTGDGLGINGQGIAAPDTDPFGAPGTAAVAEATAEEEAAGEGEGIAASQPMDDAGIECFAKKITKAVVGQFYQIALGATDGSNLSYELGGELPGGLRLESDGKVSGMPTKAGTSIVLVNVMDEASGADADCTTVIVVQKDDGATVADNSYTDTASVNSLAGSIANGASFSANSSASLMANTASYSANDSADSTANTVAVPSAAKDDDK